MSDQPNPTVKDQIQSGQYLALLGVGDTPQNFGWCVPLTSLKHDPTSVENVIFCTPFQTCVLKSKPVSDLDEWRLRI